MVSNPTSVLLFLLCVFSASLVLTGAAVWMARRLRLLAQPVARSSHRVPTPQVGGVGICLSMLGAWILFPAVFSIALLDWGLPRVLFDMTPAWMFALVATLGLALGFIDDILHLSALKKLLGLFFVAAIPLLQLTPLFPAEQVFPFAPFLDGLVPWPRFFESILLFAWLLFFINAFNFMDGVNGQSGVFALLAVLWWTLMSHSELLVGSQYFAVNWLQIAFLLIPAAAVLGFLPWNFPRALTFMGDSGSLPLGGILALMAAWGGRDSLDSLLAHLFPLSLFIYDVLFTVVRRARRGENLMAAHRGHLYQRMLIATHWSHARLLAFHLPYYLATGALGLGYHIAFGPNARFALPPFVGRLGFFLALAVLLNWYTTKVWRAEKHVAAPSRETQT